MAKIRQDFVSNSSSSSFIVNDVAKSIGVLKKHVTPELIPYNFDLTIRLFTKNKDHNDVYKFFDLDGCRDPYWQDTYEDYRTHKIVKKDPDEISWDTIDAYWEKILTADIPDEIVNKIDHIEFYCSDGGGNMGKSYLNAFYDFFRKMECDPDDSVSEQGFRGSHNLISVLNDAMP